MLWRKALESAQFTQVHCCLDLRVKPVTEQLLALFIPRVNLPVDSHFVEAPKVHWASAHGTPRASAFEVPRLDALAAEHVSTHQLHGRLRVTVADCALHFFRSVPTLSVFLGEYITPFFCTTPLSTVCPCLVRPRHELSHHPRGATVSCV